QVDRVYPEGRGSSVQMDTVDSQLGTYYLQDWFGYDGTGVKLAQIEMHDGNGQGVNVLHPNIPNVVNDLTYSCSSLGGEHSNGVAGIMVSNHPVYRGIAYKASLWAGGSCEGTDAQCEA